MQIVAIDGYKAQCTAKGVMREVSLFMLQDEPIVVKISARCRSRTARAS